MFHDRFVEFSFSSQLAHGVAPEDVLRLVGQAWRDNRRSRVTGFMRLAGAQVEQTIEGPCAVILDLSARILTDRRHDRIAIRTFGPIAARRYDDWRVEGLACAAPLAAPVAGGLRLVPGMGERPVVPALQPLAVAIAT